MEEPLTAWERVQTARDIKRPTALYYIEQLFDGFLEFHGDHGFADDAAIVGGIAWFGGRAVTVIGQEKGATTQEKVRRNFGSPHPEGYRKALRLMKQAEKFHRPVVCLVDTQGAYCGIGAEERGQGMAIAENLAAMSTLKTPIISIVIGEGGSGGALAMGVADKVAVLENAIYSVLSPEGFASILWKDASRAEEAAAVMKLTARELLALGVVDDVVAEPPGGAQQDAKKQVQLLAAYLQNQLDVLCGMETSLLVAKRYEKFRAMGKV